MENLIDEFAAAEYLSLSLSTLRKDRSKPGIKLPYLRVGRAVRYLRSDLEAWVRSQVVNAATQPPVQPVKQAQPLTGKRGPGRPRRTSDVVPNGELE